MGNFRERVSLLTTKTILNLRDFGKMGNPYREIYRDKI